MEVAGCIHTKFFLPRGKANQQMTVPNLLESWREAAMQRTEEGVLGEGKESLAIPVLLRESSRCHQPCYRLEPQQHEQAPWPSCRFCSCPRVDGCHPGTEARTDPSPPGHFLKEGSVTMKIDPKKSFWGSFVMNLFLLKPGETSLQKRGHAPPLQ